MFVFKLLSIKSPICQRSGCWNLVGVLVFVANSFAFLLCTCFSMPGGLVYRTHKNHSRNNRTAIARPLAYGLTAGMSRKWNFGIVVVWNGIMWIISGEPAVAYVRGDKGERRSSFDTV